MTAVGEVATAPLLVFERSFGREAFAIRDYLTRSGVPFQTILIETEEDCRDQLGAALTETSLPVVVFPDGTRLADPTPAQIAEHFGWIKRPKRSEYDVLVYGAGPAGLSAAVYAASEGLDVAVVERDAVGGQAGSSSLIENYLGFAHGISGAALAEQARRQAIAFGAELLVMRHSLSRSFGDHHMQAELADGSRLSARAVICATGVQWRRLGLPLEDELEGSGVFYGAGTSEASSCVGEHVYIVGGANSAGQAAMNLAAHAELVTVLVRGPSLSSTMSTYLLRRLLAAPNVEILVDTRVTALHGDDRLRALTVESAGTITEVPAADADEQARGRPNTAWAEDSAVALDSRGFLLTGGDLLPEHLTRWPLARQPMHLETNQPGVFAAGDVRANSIKRVASAVGEGAMAVSLTHRYLAETYG
jgi:thioredoxin reductase (NADPH)